MLRHALDVSEITRSKKSSTRWRALTGANSFLYHTFRVNRNRLRRAKEPAELANIKTTAVHCDKLIEMYFPVQPFSNLYKYQSFWVLLSVFVSEWGIYKNHVFLTATECVFRRMWPLNCIKLSSVRSFDEPPKKILLLVMSLFGSNQKSVQLAEVLLYWDARNKALKHGPIEVMGELSLASVAPGFCQKYQMLSEVFPWISLQLKRNQLVYVSCVQNPRCHELQIWLQVLQLLGLLSSRILVSFFPMPSWSVNMTKLPRHFQYIQSLGESLCVWPFVLQQHPEASSHSENVLTKGVLAWSVLLKNQVPGAQTTTLRLVRGVSAGGLCSGMEVFVCRREAALETKSVCCVPGCPQQRV